MTFQQEDELMVEIENQPGSMARVLRAVAEAKVHVRAFVGYSMGPTEGYVHLLPSDIKAAKAALKKAGFAKITQNSVVTGAVKDKVGTAAEVAERAGAAGINLLAAYATGTGKGTGIVVLSPEKKDVRKLLKALS